RPPPEPHWLPVRATRARETASPPSGAITVRNPRTPLGLVDRLVRFEQGALALAAQRIEARRQMVVDEHVLCAGDAEPGLLHAAAVVVVLEEADAEGLVHAADALERVAAHRHAEERGRADRDALAGMG